MPPRDSVEVSGKGRQGVCYVLSFFVRRKGADCYDPRLLHGFKLPRWSFVELS